VGILVGRPGSGEGCGVDGVAHLEVSPA
jgi:hypothetical protein